MGLTANEYQYLFTGLGTFVSAVYKFQAMATGTGTPNPDLPDLYHAASGFANVLANLGSGTAPRHDALEGMLKVVEDLQDEACRWADDMAKHGDAMLQDKEEIFDKFPALLGTTVQDVLQELIKDMTDTSQSIDDNTCYLGAPSYDAGNNGDGTLISTIYLDGVSPPSAGFASHRDYEDVATELVTSETLTIECISDSETDGLPEGEEIFRIKGEPTNGFRFGWRNEGSGVNQQMATLNASGLLSNKDMELWTASGAGAYPSNWTVETGTPGTHIGQETNTLLVYRGNSALRLTGDGSLAEIKLSQAIPKGLLQPNKMYCIMARVAGSTFLAAGEMYLQFESASGQYNPATATTGGVAERVYLNNAALSASGNYVLRTYWMIMPPVIPDDFKFVIKLNGTPTNGVSVYVDSITIGPAVYANGIGFAIAAGADPWLRGDRITVQAVNDDASIWQDYFRRHYKVQLPSSASPTIAASLVP